MLKFVCITRAPFLVIEYNYLLTNFIKKKIFNLVTETGTAHVLMKKWV